MGCGPAENQAARDDYFFRAPRRQALERIVAAGTSPQGTSRERPVFPYPLQARYDGSGSVDEAGNFVPVRPAGGSNVIEWAGSYLYEVPGPVAR